MKLNADLVLRCPHCNYVADTKENVRIAGFHNNIFKYGDDTQLDNENSSTCEMCHKDYAYKIAIKPVLVVTKIKYKEVE